MSDEYGAFKDDKLPSNLETVLIQLADELVAAEEAVTQKEAELEVAKEYHKDIAEKRIPSATEGLNGKLLLSDGRTLEVSEKIRASIAGEKRVPAINWLDENDYGHIVKRQVIVEFSKGQEELAAKFMEHLKAFPSNLVVKNNHSVHHMTLEAFIREKLGEGVDLPTETFGIYRQRTAKVKD